MLVVEICCAGAFRRYHERAYRTFRRAFLSKQLALRGLEHSFQHLTALGRLGIGDANTGDPEALLSVPLRVSIADTQSGLRNETHAAPLEIGTQLEDLGHGSQSRPAALPRDHALVLIFHLRFAGLELL